MNMTLTKPMKVLLVGGPDRAQSMTELAGRMGLQVCCACPETEHVSVRDLVRALAESGAARDGVEGGKLHQLLCQGDWDVILVRQFSPAAGLTATFDADVECLLDYFAHRCPNAKVYWDMAWAFGPDSSVFPGYFKVFYDSDTALMYNAIARVVDQCILHGEFAHRFSGWIPTGAVIQQLRQQWGREVTCDGFHLEEQAAVAYALTALHVLFPQARLESACTADIAQTIRQCCADLSVAPQLLDTPPARTIEEEGKHNDFTALQMTAPLALYFPDMVCLKDGRMLMGVYEHCCHVPYSNPENENYALQGPGRILVLEGTADGRNWDYEHPLLVVDEVFMAQQDIVHTRGRYQRLRRGETDYCILSDPRDPNLGLVHSDLTGDGEKDEVIVLTYWMCNYYPNGSDHEVYTVQSADGGRTWMKPQRMEREDGFIPLKRGDMAVFSDGEMLFPYYSLRRESSRVGVIHLRWDIQSQRWERIGDYQIPNTAPWEGNSFNFNEVSLVIPDPADQVVYGFVRESGAVMRSTDRGRTWCEVGCEPGLIHQPGFALMDGRRVFTSWARSRLPRTIYGKAFYPKAGWDHSRTQLIYASPETSVHDMADPSCKQLADGRVLIYCYDTAFRSIIGTIIDPEEEAFQPIELQDNIPAGLLAQGDLGHEPAEKVALTQSVPASATLALDLRLAPGGRLSLSMGRAGQVTFLAGEGDLPQQGEGTLYVAFAGQLLWCRWGRQDGWTAISTVGEGSDSITLTADGISVGHWQLTRRVSIGMDEAIHTVEGGPDIRLEPRLEPLCDCVTYHSQEEQVARVDTDGVLHVGRAGTSRIRMEADGVSAWFDVYVQPAQRQMSDPGPLLFADDFGGYKPGPDAFLAQMADHGYTLGQDAGAHPRRAYDIAQVEQSDCLLLRSGFSSATQFAIDRAVSGEVTLQFDFLFTHPRTGKSSILTSPGQMLRVDLFHGTSVCGVVQLTPEGVRIEHKPGGIRDSVTAPEKFRWDVIYPLNRWHTAKLVRVKGGICVKIWPAGQAEPERWSYVLMSPELVAEEAAGVGFHYEVQMSPGQQLALKALTLHGGEL